MEQTELRQASKQKAFSMEQAGFVAVLAFSSNGSMSRIPCGEIPDASN